MKIDLTLDKFRDKKPVPIKTILGFHLPEINRRLKTFFLYDKNLKNLSTKELREWIKMYQVNAETEINIKVNMDKIEKEKNRSMSTKTKLIFILYSIIELSFLRYSEFKEEDLGRTVCELKDYEEPVKVNVIEPRVQEKKMSRKDMLTLKRI